MQTRQQVSSKPQHSDLSSKPTTQERQEVTVLYTHSATSVPGIIQQETNFDTRVASNGIRGKLVGKARMFVCPFGITVEGKHVETKEEVRAVIPFANVKMYLLK